jgi:diguanylate cyclase (GGDEF)-like protein
VRVFKGDRQIVETMTDPSRRLYRRFALCMIGLFAILGLILAIVAVQVYRTVGDLVQANKWVNHTYQTREQIVTTVGALRATEAAQRAYIIGGDAGRLAEAYAAVPRLSEHMTMLHDLVADNPAQTENAESLQTLLAQRKDLMARSLATYQKSGLQQLRSDPRFAVARDQDVQVDEIAARMIALEDTLLAQRQRSSQATALLSRLLTVAAIAMCFGVLALALFLILREQRRRVAGEARVTASNVELARSLEESRRLGGTLHQLSDLGHMLQGCRSLDEAAAGLTAAMGKLFQGTAGSVNLINASQNLIAPVGQWGGAIDGDAVFAPDECWALRLGHAYPEAQTSTKAFICKHLQTEPARDVRTQLCVPLLAQGTVLGTLVLLQDEAILAETRTAAVAAAEQISLAIANLRLQETLRTQSLRDPLTGLFNRRYLEVSLARDLARAIRRNQPLTVLMLDVDHFKRFNDTYGHDAGDALLTQFGELLMASVHSEDVACRYGGEEFTIVLQEADAALALDRAEDIRQGARKLQVRYRNQVLSQVTVSIGIASYPQHGDSPEQLLRRADRALYVAKDGGRDQVCVADRS